MGKITRCVAIAAFAMLLPSIACAQVWSPRASMPAGRSSAATAVVGNTVYVVGGYGEGDGCQYRNDNQAFDAVANTWSTKAPLPWTADGPAAATINGLVYAVGGLTGCGGTISSLASYNPSTNSWTARASMSTGRGRFGAAAVNGVLYAIGGGTGSQVTNKVEAYIAATNTWSPKASMPTSRMWFGTAELNGLIYIFGGWNGASAVPTVEMYNPATDTWTTRAPMPTARVGTAATVLDGLIYVVGAEYTMQQTALVEVYNPATNTWSTGTPMSTARGTAAIATANGRVHVFGGSATNGTILSSSEMFGPAPTYTLAVTNGTGIGVVTSSPGGIDCGTTCAASFTGGTSVTLTASPFPGARFVGWSGACSSASPTCVVTMNSAVAVTASFGSKVSTTVALASNPNPSTAGQSVSFTATVSGAGGTPTGSVTFRNGGADLCAGVVLSSGQANCATSSLGAGNHVITAEYSGDATFVSNLSPNFVQTVNPGPVALTVSKSGGGSGTVVSTPAGIDCGSTCSASFSPGTSVTLAATPASGSVFGGWSGAGCSGTATCVVSLTSAAAVTAAFDPEPGALALSASALDFGGQSMGTASPPQTLTVTNTGQGPVTVGTIAISSPQFAQVTNCTTLAAGASCSIDVSFVPASVPGALNATVPVTATLTIPNTSAAGALSVPLAGTAEKSLVSHYYRAILNRTPDAAGKTFWEGEAARLSALGVDVNETWFVMAGYFFNSAEYRAANRSDTAFVTDLYNTFFNRGPDAGGLGYWVSQIQSGLPREVVLFSFMFSNEFRTFTQGIFGNTSARPEVDMVVDFFRGLLNRLPDTEAFNYWLAQIRTAQCQGAGPVYTSVDAISAAFMFNPEYTARGRTHMQFVTDMYYSFLRRGGDIAGVQYWINQLASGARYPNDVRYFGFLNSPEFGARVGAVIAAGCQSPISITSLSTTTAAPFRMIRIAATNLQAGAPAKVRFFNTARGFSATLDATAVAADGSVRVGVPMYYDSTLNDFGPGSVSITVEQGTRVSAPVSFDIADLPTSASHGLALGDVSQALLVFNSLQLGKRLSMLKAASVVFGTDTSAEQAAVRDLLQQVVRARTEIDLIRATPTTAVSGGTARDGTAIQFDRDAVDMMDRVGAAFFQHVIARLPATAAAGQAKAFTRNSTLFDVVKAMKGAGDAITLGDALFTVVTDDVIDGTTPDPDDKRLENLIADIKGAVAIATEVTNATVTSGRGKFLSKRLGVAFSLYDSLEAMTLMALDAGELWVAASNGNDPVEIQRIYANMSKHQLKALDSSINFLSLGLVSVVAAGPATDGISNFKLVSSLQKIMDAGIDKWGPNQASLTLAQRIAQGIGPEHRLARVNGVVSNGNGQSMFDFCCFGSGDIVGIGDPAGSFAAFIPANAPSTNYGSITFRARDPLTNTALVTQTVNLSSRSATTPITVSVTITRDCLAEYNACTARCTTGTLLQQLQCVNACLATWQQCQ